MFKVLSDRLSGHKKGSTIDAGTLDGANINALVQGEHITPIDKTQKTDKEEPKEK
jgi:hypothetical protein